MMDPIDSPVLPPRHRPRIDGYRVFMTVVFCGIVALDTWADRTLSLFVSGDVVGPLSIVLWVLTLLGSVGIGPMGHLKSAMRW